MIEEFETSTSYKTLDSEWRSWQSVPFGDQRLLPSESGIYVVADSNNYLWYVGQAVDIRRRWLDKNHHRYPQLVRTNKRLIHRIYWQVFLISQLNEKERFYINLFNPELNHSEVKSYLPKAKSVDDEIKRLFKVLNNLTRIFPIIRSVIIGAYENEEGVQCILTVISFNDYDLLCKSATKH